MGLYRLPLIRQVIQTWAADPGGMPMQQFLDRSQRLLEASEAPDSNSFREPLNEAAANPDLQLRHSLSAQLTSEEGQAFLEQIAPAVAAQYLEIHGVATLEKLLAEETVPFLEGATASHMKTAFHSSHPATNVAVGAARILDAANRMAQSWEQIQSSEFIPLEAGALATCGEFDSVMMLLYQQGTRFSWQRRPDGQQKPPRCLGVHTRSGSESNVVALRYSAGIQKKGLPIHQFQHPFRTIAFPQHVESELRARVQEQFYTPAGEHITTAFSETALANTARDASISYSTKSFTETGQDVDEWTSAVANKIGRPDICFNYVSGFTGAGSVFANELPELKRFKRNALHLGYGVSDLEKGLHLALQHTGHFIDGKTNVWDLVSQVAEVVEYGGAKVYTVKNLALEYPVVISVYDDPDLRKAQRLFAIYKNIYSGILGQELFQWAFEKLQRNNFTDSEEMIAQMIDEAEAHYRQMMEEAQEELVTILTEVEGIPAEKAIILDLSRIDAQKSWGMKKGGMGHLFQLIRNIFKSREQETPDMTKRLIQEACQKWRNEIEDVWSTRNPRAGASLGAGTEGTRALWTSDPMSLVPKGVTFEGLTTALNLDKRLNDSTIQKLPQRVKDFLEMARLIRQPINFPEAPRQKMSALVHFLETRASGTKPTREEIEAFLCREVSDEEVNDDFRWRASFKADVFIQAVKALKHHLEQGAVEIAKRGRENPHLVEKSQEYIQFILDTLELLIVNAHRVDQAKPLAPLEVQGLIHALKMLIMEGDRVYMGDPIDDVMREMGVRMERILEYLRIRHRHQRHLDRVELPRPYPNSVSEGRLRARQAARPSQPPSK